MNNDSGSRQDINIKIVYYGPALSGKTTNLEHIYSKLPPESKGKMVSMKTRTDRTLFFDFLPLKIEKVRGTTIKFLIYTVPGQVYYNATRKLVLNGVDAVVFVADSTPGKMDANLESLQNLKDNLSENGMTMADIPVVFQYNKRDAGDCLSLEELEKELNPEGAEYFEAVAVDGRGVYQTFESIARKVFKRVKEEINRPEPAETAGEGQTEEPPSGIEATPAAEISAGRDIDSEADESESLKSAEERKEEHTSVSEFVDQVLTEDDSAPDLEFEGNDDDFKEYGHTVELGDGMTEKAETGPEVAVEFINDPLERLDPKEAEPEKESEPDQDVEPDPRSIRIPVKLSRYELEESDFRIILELELE
ncbi:MAG: hypothetical protein GF417_07320 [Candidatus Latescibacteria bacterium]|nr:hypothetical protein [bacterium]MBD3424229.1 hypothetical protein [Candidatus Latescibacterota bacterium]